MHRRMFIKTTALSGLALKLNITPWDKSHIISLSFDDGFKRSFYRIADIYEKSGVAACFNVIASGHLKSFKGVDQWILPELMGNFNDWNALQSRGHEIMPHSWKHLNLTEVPLRKAKRLIDKCLDYFKDHLQDYQNRDAVFNFPFNASTPELESYLLKKVLAVRTSGPSAVNEIPKDTSYGALMCHSFGPDNMDTWLEQKINQFLESSGGWLIINAHGLDNEGWGPISDTYLSTLIPRLVNRRSVKLMPVGRVLKQYAS